MYVVREHDDKVSGLQVYCGPAAVVEPDVTLGCGLGDLQLKANMLRSVTGSGIPVPFYHAVLPMLGVDIGLPRRPFLPLPEEEVERIRKVLTETKMLIG